MPQTSPSSNSTYPAFSEVIASALELHEDAGPATLAELLFTPLDGEDDSRAILLGTLGEGQLTVSLRSLRHAIVSLSGEFNRLGLVPGDTVCLARLPRTSESLAAALYAALTACGLRVLFPMYLDAEDFAAWLKAAEAKAIFWAAAESRIGRRREGDLALLSKLEATAQTIRVPAYCFEKDLHLSMLLQSTPQQHTLNSPEVQRILTASSASDIALILTTSGSSGRAKLVRYRQQAILNSCRAWQQCGMFSAGKLGGRCLCLLLAHSMGLRAFWNALWTRQPLCLIPPEWFLEHPDRARALLLEMKPEHITGGPAAFHTVLELSRIYPDLKDVCFQHLRCAVSSGAPFTPTLRERVKDALGLDLENGFGMTETMQVLSTLVDGPLSQTNCMMGNPLPGVEVGLESTSGAAHKLWLRTAFGFDGYQPFPATEDSPAKTADGWFDTGDLVERTAGRAALHRPPGERLHQGQLWRQDSIRLRR